MKLLEDGCDAVSGGGSGDDAGCWVQLDQLEFMEGFVGETREEGVAVVHLMYTMCTLNGLKNSYSS